MPQALFLIAHGVGCELWRLQDLEKYGRWHIRQLSFVPHQSRVNPLRAVQELCTYAKYLSMYFVFRTLGRPVYGRRLTHARGCLADM